MSIFKAPKAVFLLAFTQLWNRFSHYGMRALLLLYMIKIVKFPEPTAIAIFAIYCAFVELGGVFGAYVADKILGLRRSVMLGGWLIGCGHLLLALEANFFVALGFIILGSGLYTTNVATLLGNFYPAGDPKREQGFTLFYMSINGGAFLATLLCGFVAEHFGWSYGFGLAAIGMVISNTVLLCFRAVLENKGEAPRPITWGRQTALALYLLIGLGLSIGLLQLEQITTSLLPWMIVLSVGLIIARLRLQREVVVSLAISLGALIAFFIAQEQIGTSLLLFADHTIDSTFSAMSLLAINPLVIMLGGPLANLCLEKMKNPALRFIVPFTLAAMAFGSLAIGAVFFNLSGLVFIGCVVAILSFAELLIGPMTYSACSEAATRFNNPQVMALMPLGFALAASLGGVYSQTVAEIGNYIMGFGILSLVLIILGFAFAHVKKRQANHSVWKNFPRG